MNQIVNLIVRRVIRQLVNRGVDAGLNAVSSKKGDGAKNAPKKDTKRTKQAMRMMRRTTKF